MSYSGNLQVENRNGLIVNAEVLEANGRAERDAALVMPKPALRISPIHREDLRFSLILINLTNSSPEAKPIPGEGNMIYLRRQEPRPPSGGDLSSRPPEWINFEELYKKLLSVDFTGTAGQPPMVGGTGLAEAVKEGSYLLPKPYIDKYAIPLENHLHRLLQLTLANRIEFGILETLTAAVYQHGGFGLRFL